MGLNAKFCSVHLKPDDSYLQLMSINDFLKKIHFVYFMLTLHNSSFLMKNVMSC